MKIHSDKIRNKWWWVRFELEMGKIPRVFYNFYLPYFSIILFGSICDLCEYMTLPFSLVRTHFGALCLCVWAKNHCIVEMVWSLNRILSCFLYSACSIRNDRRRNNYVSCISHESNECERAYDEVRGIWFLFCSISTA